MAGLGDALWDLGFGSRCVGCQLPGKLLCSGCWAELPDTAQPARPTPCPSGLAEVRVAGDYQGLLRAMILTHKERRGWSLAAPLGQSLAVAVEGFPLDGGRDDVVTLLVGVPSQPRVLRQRGHDPMGAITRAAAARLRQGAGRRVLATGLLRHRGLAADQSGLDTQARRQNLDGALAVRTPLLRALAREGRPIRALVCDDVVTTGATARESQRALTDVGIQVLGIAAVAATRKLLPEFGQTH